MDLIEKDPVITWLLEGDPAVRWQVQRDLLGLPAETWRPVRAAITTQGEGAALLAAQDEDGQWDGGALFPAGFTEQLYLEEGQPWTTTQWSLAVLRGLGAEPTDPALRSTASRLRSHCTWEHDGEPFWDGEVEECINGRVVSDAVWLGIDATPVVRRLLGEQQDDGGWNCERADGSLRSSFDSTINVLEGLTDYEQALRRGNETGAAQRADGTAPEELARARRGGEEYLAVRGLFRSLSTGEPAQERYLTPVHPPRWRYDILRGLEHFRSASTLEGDAPDPRLADAVGHLESLRRYDGTWPAGPQPRGWTWYPPDAPEGEPSRWITLRALRVLAWWDAGHAQPSREEVSPPAAP